MNGEDFLTVVFRNGGAMCRIVEDESAISTWNVGTWNPFLSGLACGLSVNVIRSLWSMRVVTGETVAPVLLPACRKRRLKAAWSLLFRSR